MGINVGMDGGNWNQVGGNFTQFSMQQKLITERREKYSFSFSDAELVQITTPETYIVYGDVIFRQPNLYFKPVQDVPDMMKMRFTLSGRATIYNHINDRKYLFNSNQQNILYMPELDGKGEYETMRNYRFFEVHYRKERFLELAEHSCRPLQLMADHMDAGRYTQIAEQSLPISPEMQDCIKSILNCHYKEGLKLMFLQSKCIELLVLQAEAFEKAIAKKQNALLQSAYDKDCIYFARDYLVKNILQPPSLTELARICGVNEFKLKQGFKGIFNNSVFGYLNDYKLNSAREMLFEGKPIKAIAAELGYSSVQHFSTAFRKKFDTSPGRMRH